MSDAKPLAGRTSTNCQYPWSWRESHHHDKDQVKGYSESNLCTTSHASSHAVRVARPRIPGCAQAGAIPGESHRGPRGKSGVVSTRTTPLGRMTVAIPEELADRSLPKATGLVWFIDLAILREEWDALHLSPHVREPWERWLRARGLLDKADGARCPAAADPARRRLTPARHESRSRRRRRPHRLRGPRPANHRPQLLRPVSPADRRGDRSRPRCPRGRALVALFICRGIRAVGESWEVRAVCRQRRAGGAVPPPRRVPTA